MNGSIVVKLRSSEGQLIYHLTVRKPENKCLKFGCYIFPYLKLLLMTRDDLKCYVASVGTGNLFHKDKCKPNSTNKMYEEESRSDVAKVEELLFYRHYRRDFLFGFHIAHH